MTMPSYPCPYCAAPFGSFEALKAHVVAEHGAEPLPKPHGLIALIVNGERHEQTVEPNTTLYTLIHDRMGLTGSRCSATGGRAAPVPSSWTEGPCSRA